WSAARPLGVKARKPVPFTSAGARKKRRVFCSSPGSRRSKSSISRTRSPPRRSTMVSFIFWWRSSQWRVVSSRALRRSRIWRAVSAARAAPARPTRSIRVTAGRKRIGRGDRPVPGESARKGPSEVALEYPYPLQHVAARRRVPRGQREGGGGHQPACDARIQEPPGPPCQPRPEPVQDVRQAERRIGKQVELPVGVVARAARESEDRDDAHDAEEGEQARPGREARAPRGVPCHGARRGERGGQHGLGEVAAVVVEQLPGELPPCVPAAEMEPELHRGRQLV